MCGVNPRPAERPAAGCALGRYRIIGNKYGRYGHLKVRSCTFHVYGMEMRASLASLRDISAIEPICG